MSVGFLKATCKPGERSDLTGCTPAGGKPGVVSSVASTVTAPVRALASKVAAGVKEFGKQYAENLSIALDETFVEPWRRAFSKEAMEENRAVLRGIFSRMTLGVGPLAAKVMAAGVKHSPKLFRAFASAAHGIGRALGWIMPEVRTASYGLLKADGAMPQVDMDLLQRSLAQLMSVWQELHDADEAKKFAMALRAANDAMQSDAKPVAKSIESCGPSCPCESCRTEDRLSSVQIDLPAALADRVRALAELIDENDLADKGIPEPHVTVRYGLHSQDAEEVQSAVDGFGAVEFRIVGMSSFADTGKGEVLKLDVDSDDLLMLHNMLGDLEHTDTHDEYRPHITLAYLKPGTAEKYASDELLCLLDGTSCRSRHVLFSDAEKRKTALSMC